MGASNWRIRAPAHGALEPGYDLTLVKDGHPPSTVVLDDGSRVEAASVIQGLNTAMAWLRDTGRGKQPHGVG